MTQLRFRAFGLQAVQGFRWFRARVPGASATAMNQGYTMFSAVNSNEAKLQRLCCFMAPALRITKIKVAHKIYIPAVCCSLDANRENDRESPRTEPSSKYTEKKSPNPSRSEPRTVSPSHGTLGPNTRGMIEP